MSDAKAPATPAAVPSKAEAPKSSGVEKMGWIALFRWLVAGLKDLSAELSVEMQGLNENARQAIFLFRVAYGRFRHWYNLRRILTLAVWIFAWQMGIRYFNGGVLIGDTLVDTTLVKYYAVPEVLCWAPAGVYFLVLFWLLKAVFGALHGVERAIEALANRDVIKAREAIELNLQPVIMTISLTTFTVLLFRLVNHSDTALCWLFPAALGTFIAMLGTSSYFIQRSMLADGEKNFLKRRAAGLASNTQKFIILPICAVGMAGFMMHTAFNVFYVRGYDCKSGPGYVAMNAAGAETAWSATFRFFTDTNEVMKKQLARAVDGAGRQAMGDHWIRGGERATGKLNNLAGVTCYDSLRGADRRCTAILASTGVNEEVTFSAFSHEECWGADGHEAAVDCFPPSTVSIAQKLLAVNRLKVATESQNWEDRGPQDRLVGAALESLHRFRLKTDVEPEYVSLEALDWKNGLPLMSHTVIPYQGTLDDIMVKQAVYEYLRKADENRKQAMYSSCVRNQVEGERPAVEERKDGTTTQVRDEERQHSNGLLRNVERFNAANQKKMEKESGGSWYAFKAEVKSISMNAFQWIGAGVSAILGLLVLLWVVSLGLPGAGKKAGGGGGGHH